MAALLELSEDPEASTVGLDSLLAAAQLLGWFRDQAEHALSVTSGTSLTADDEREVLGWLVRRRATDRRAGREPQEWITARDVQRGPRRYRDARLEPVEAVLAQLEDAGWLARADSAGRTDARARWRVRPDLEQRWEGT